MGYSGSLKIALFDRMQMSSYQPSTSIVSMSLSYTVSESKIANFNLQHLYLAPSLQVTPIGISPTSFVSGVHGPLGSVDSVMLRSSIIPTSVCVCVCVCFSRPDRLRDIADRFNLDQEAVLDNVLYARAYTSNHLYHSASYTAFTSFFRICILLEFHKSVKSGSFSMVQISKHICIEMLMFH